MRAVSFVEHIDFEFNGSVLRNGLTLGDIDNDGDEELIVGSENGDVSIFKGCECWQTLHNLGFVASVVVGDILNRNENSLVIVSADGWCHIYHMESKLDADGTLERLFNTEEDQSEQCSSRADQGDILRCVHTQRIPTDTKVALLADIDNDGAIELVLGLTDRVVRSYRWTPDAAGCSKKTTAINGIQGKLVGLNKWECANQIGSVTLHHSSDGTPCLMVAQPGGTFMRIRCQMDDAVEPITENFDMSESNSIRSESFAASFVDYQFLGLSRMRNQNISTEILGDLNTVIMEKDLDSQSDNKPKGKPYAVATLDGTIMLVQDEVILWAIQVDHQTFALNKLDITGNGCDDIVVCSWDGQTYILDQNKNSVRFHLDQPVQAFCTGYYTVVPGEKAVPCLVYVTFSNKVLLYHDVKLPSMTVERFNPDLTKCNDMEKLLEQIQISEPELDGFSRRTKQQIVDYLLYKVKDNESN